MRLRNLLLIILITAIHAVSCAQNSESESITVDSLKQRMNNDSTLVILDVRTKAELSGPLGHLDGVIHIPVHELHNRITELNKFKEKEIAVICRTGNRSGAATALLNNKGYKALNVLGGMVEWRNKFGYEEKK
ncbi:MAG: rhodanese-like domain-containing protein [Melioribacteraceae bacterium]|nr:rhodanese-like domain-containing protein [Melioribacteraceae bacterium]